MKSETTVKASGVDIVVALDMSAAWFGRFVVERPTGDRFNMRAVRVLKEFIDKRSQRLASA